MGTFFQRLRRAPVHTRRLIAMITTFFIMALVVLFWLRNLQTTLHDSDLVQDDTKTLTSPLGVVGDNLSNLMREMNTSFGKMKNEFMNTVTPSGDGTVATSSPTSEMDSASSTDDLENTP